MASALAAFKEAWVSYRKNLTDYLIYSFIANVTIQSLALILVFGGLATGALSFAAIKNVSVSLDSISLLLSLGVILIGMLVLVFATGGLYGAFLESTNGFLSGKRQTISSFISMAGRRALPVTWVMVAAAIVILIPSLAMLYGASALGGGLVFFAIAAIAMLLLAALITILLIFAIPAVVVNNLGAFKAIGKSMGLAVRNLPSVIGYIVIGILLGIPLAVPVFNIFYNLLFYAPIMTAALMVLYRSCR